MQFYYRPSILYFGMPMGLLGAGLNAQHLQEIFSLEYNFALGLLIYGWVSLWGVAIHYVSHLFGESRRGLLQEWLDPFKRSFFPAITLTMMLFILSLQSYASLISLDQTGLLFAYYVVVVFHGFLNLQVINLWLFREDVALNQHKPTWFILLSGNFVVVITGVQLSIISHSPLLYELLWLFFSAGLLLWLTFTTSLFYRLIFEQPLQRSFRPSLFIFLAPPSLGTIASLFIMEAEGAEISLGIPLVTWGLYSFATVMLLVWITLSKFFIQSGTSMAGWSYVYPLAAYGLATQYLSVKLESLFLQYMSVVIFIGVLAFIALLTVWLIKQSVGDRNVSLPK
ncbi:MAG: hypothetical protein GXO35_08385 [Gammaproteobacteria bacterium]|nr:hypothetical protein [Gammaproteobacteria bacterium]